MGFGVQYSTFNLKGKRIPILISEQGVGRGLEPLTPFLNEFGDGAGGDWHTSYGAKPIYLSSNNRSMLLYNREIIVFDLRQSEFVEIEVFGDDAANSLGIAGRLISGQNPLEMVSEISLVSGRQRPLPEWCLDGAILGVEGGQV